MTVQTKVIWDLPMAQETYDQVTARGIELFNEGLETSPAIINVDPANTQKTVDRFWVDNASALNWISFVETFNPVSAAIVD